MPIAKLIAPTTKQEIPKLRVAAYCRVSSNSADQRNSFATQERVYRKQITENPDWELVDIFADEGLSGMKADTRPEFQRMIRMCELHQIDLILTKSVSRFARNVKEALSYTRKLKLLGVGVQFEEDGVNTLAMADEMLLNTFAAIAQEESKSISQNQRLSIVKRMEAGEYIASNAPYGYRLIDKKLVIYEPEAEIVRWIFTAYLNGMSTLEIAQELSHRGIPTKGRKEQWKANRVAYILTNEKYDGNTLFQKYYGETTVPFKKHRNYGEVDQFFASGTHDAILPAGMFQDVQALLQSRGHKFGKKMNHSEYPLTSRIRCSECGAFYHRKVRNGTVKWVCARHAADTTACDSHYYSETRIYDGIFEMFLAGQPVKVIAQTLQAEKIEIPGKDLSFSKNMIMNILRNEKYCGDCILQKTVTVDCISKTRKANHGEAPMYLVENSHPAIISRDIFHRAQEELARRKALRPKSDKTSITQSGKYSKYALSEVLHCAECGSRYKRVTWNIRGKKKIVWRCVSRLDYGKKYCKDSVTAEEAALHVAVVRALNRFHAEDESTYLTLMKATIGEAIGINGGSEEIDLLTHRIDALNKRMLDLVNETVAAGKDVESSEEEFKEISDQIEQLTRRIAAIQESVRGDATRQARLEEIQDIIAKRTANETQYDDSIVRQMIECIKVHGDGRLTIIFGGGYEIEETL